MRDELGDVSFGASGALLSSGAGRKLVAPAQAGAEYSVVPANAGTQCRSGRLTYNSMMATTLDELERQVRALSASDKAALAHLLIEELDASADADADRAWIEEAQRRYDAFIAGELSAIPGDGVMSRARTRLK